VKLILALFLIFSLPVQHSQAQIVERGDTVINSRGTIVTGETVVSEAATSRYSDSVRHRRIKKTILRSTFVPGWGQVTNRQIWKVPLVATAITVPAVLFFYNLNTYKELRDAYIIRMDGDDNNDDQIPIEYQPLSDNSIQFYRDTYRQNVDYSALVFLLAWGLNVVDAAVFANLKDFDVSDKLSLKIKPGFNFNGQSSVGLVLTFKAASSRKRYFTN
jgi:hypothetical protein